MMDRYAALAWSPMSADQAERARRLSVALRAADCGLTVGFEAPGRAVLHTRERGARFARHPVGESGVALGALFLREGERAPLAPGRLPASVADAAVASNGAALTRSCWGRYIAFLRDQAAGATIVLRDPSGAAPGYRLVVDDVVLIFSHLDLVAGLPGVRLTVDWSYVIDNFLNPELAGSATGYREVEELTPGARYAFSPDGVDVDLCWTPASFCRDSLEDADEAAAALIEEARVCIESWAAAYGRILHSLSGGLDSAIVLSLLAAAAAAPEIACFNYYTPEEDGDERRFARAAAARAGLTLWEAPMPSAFDGFDALARTVPRTARPDLRIFVLGLDRLQEEAGRAHAAECYMSGEGGDHLFLRAPREGPLADYAAIRGFDRRFMEIAMDCARQSRRPVGDMIWRALVSNFGSGAPVGRPPPFRHPFVKRGAIAARRSAARPHPWKNEIASAPPGKRFQAECLPAALMRRPVFGRCERADIVHPLLSQPLIETCLRIPTYVLNGGGRDRGLARRAFREHLPREILYRETKGSTGSYLGGLFSSNLSRFREYILGGVLIEQAFIDRAGLERLLTPEGIARPDALFPILKAAASEFWLRQQETSQRRA